MMKRNSFDIRSLSRCLSINTVLPESPAAIRQGGSRSSVTPPEGERHTQPVTIARRISRGKQRVGYSRNGFSCIHGVVVTNIIN